MPLTRPFIETINECIDRDPSFAHALWNEAIDLFLSGEHDTARLMLRDIVNATMGFECLAKATSIPSKSLHRMLSLQGNPGMANLAGIFSAIQNHLCITTQTKSIVKPARKAKPARKRLTKRAS